MISVTQGASHSIPDSQALGELTICEVWLTLIHFTKIFTMAWFGMLFYCICCFN